MSTRTESGPHAFVMLSRWLHRRKCLHCYRPRRAHPTGWVPARALGDTR